MIADFFKLNIHRTTEKVDFWFARDLQEYLEYESWENFQILISDAARVCEVVGYQASDHFLNTYKMVNHGSEVQHLDDIMLTRYACYLIVQNGDPRKPKIAFAQTYFAIQTRKAELIEQRLLETERVLARRKPSDTEKELSNVIYEQTGGNNNFALIRSKGDQALFGKSTKAMKAQWRVPDSRPLADFAPTIILKAKDFATEITIYNARTQNMSNEPQISQEHVTNNQAVRETLLNRGIRPENLPPAEDVKKLERRLTSAEKNALKNPDSLENNE